MADSELGTYKDIASAIIKKQIGLIGATLATKKARNVSGLQIGENGEVFSITEDSISTIGNLVRQYADISGDTAIQFCREAIEPVLADHPGTNLPKELQVGFSLQENFLSAL